LTGVVSNCRPQNNYPVYNFYCDGKTLGSNAPTIEPTLSGANITCHHFSPVLSGINACQPVEAFIDVGTVPSYQPIFYRCYWTAPTNSGVREVLQHEWSASSEFIQWYVNNYYSSGTPPYPGSVYDILFILGLLPSLPSGATDFLVPLLKVTNHSPQSF
jgi:hypothetical protein